MNFKLLNLKLSKKIMKINFRKYKPLMMILYLTLRRMQLRRSYWNLCRRRTYFILFSKRWNFGWIRLSWKQHRRTHRLYLLPLRQLKSDLKGKLPKIELSKFSGQALKWQTFWDQFGSAIYLKESDEWMYFWVEFDYSKL